MSPVCTYTFAQGILLVNLWAGVFLSSCWKFSLAFSLRALVTDQDPSVQDSICTKLQCSSIQETYILDIRQSSKCIQAIRCASANREATASWQRWGCPKYTMRMAQPKKYCPEAELIPCNTDISARLLLELSALIPSHPSWCNHLVRLWILGEFPRHFRNSYCDFPTKTRGTLIG